MEVITYGSTFTCTPISANWGLDPSFPPSTIEKVMDLDLGCAYHERIFAAMTGLLTPCLGFVTPHLKIGRISVPSDLFAEKFGPGL